MTATPRFKASDGVCPAKGRPNRQDAAAPHRHQAQQRLPQVPLSIARHPGDAQDFAPADAEADGVQPALHPAAWGDAACADLSEFQRCLADFPSMSPGVRRLGGGGADHCRDQALGVKVAARSVDFQPATTQHRDFVGHCQGFPHFMSDEQDGISVFFQCGKHSKQVVNLMGRKHAGRLIEYQEPGPRPAAA